MAAYTTPALIAQYLGLAVSAAWTAQATTNAQVASDYLDQWLGRTWQGTSPLTETHTLYGERLWTTRPITTVTSLKVRGTAPGDTETTLTDGTDFRVLSAAAGEISISGYEGYRVTVVYESAGLVPEPVKLATTKLAAHELFHTLHPEAQRLVRLRDDTLALDYREEPEGLPSDVLRLVEPYRDLRARVA